MAPPQLFGHTASIHRQVDPERPLIGRPIEVRGFLEGGRLLQMRDLIEVYEVLKISDFFPRYGSQRPRFNSRVGDLIEVCEVLKISNFLHHYRSRRPRLSSTRCQD